MLFCSSCGTGLQSGTFFCPECGAKIEQSSATVTTTPPIEEKEPPVVQENKTVVITATPAFPEPVPEPIVQTKKSFCRNCGTAVEPGAFACFSCGLPPLKAKNFCPSCGATSHPEAVICIKCGIVFEKITSAPKPVQQTVYSTPPTSSSSNPPDIVSNTGFWGSLLLIIGFFTSWFNFGGIVSFSGYKILTLAGEEMGNGRDNDTTIIMVISLAVLALASLICFLYTLGLSVGDGSYNVCKMLPLICLLIMGITIGIQANNDGGWDDGIFDVLGIGVYLSLVGSVLLVASKARQ